MCLETTARGETKFCLAEAGLLVASVGFRPEVTRAFLGVPAEGWLIIVFWSQPWVTRGFHRLGANNRFERGGCYPGVPTPRV